jgi:DNA-binding NtrC family response regulator
MYRYKILIVDDDRLLQNSLRTILSEKYDPLIAGSGEDAVRLLTEKPVDLVLLDIRLPGMDGIETLQRIKAIRPDLLVIMMTAFEDIKTVITSMKMGGYDYLVKPLEVEMFELVIEKALETLRLKKEVEELRRFTAKSSTSKTSLVRVKGLKRCWSLPTRWPGGTTPRS